MILIPKFTSSRLKLELLNEQFSVLIQRSIFPKKVYYVYITPAIRASIKLIHRDKRNTSNLPEPVAKQTGMQKLLNYKCYSLVFKLLTKKRRQVISGWYYLLMTGSTFLYREKDFDHSLHYVRTCSVISQVQLQNKGTPL